MKRIDFKTCRIYFIPIHYIISFSHIWNYQISLILSKIKRGLSTFLTTIFTFIQVKTKNWKFWFFFFFLFLYCFGKPINNFVFQFKYQLNVVLLGKKRGVYINDQKKCLEFSIFDEEICQLNNRWCFVNCFLSYFDKVSY